MLRQALIYTAIALAVGTGAATKCDSPATAGSTSFGDRQAPTAAPPAPPSKTIPWCTPSSPGIDTWIDKCHMPPAPPENQAQPTWALEQAGDIDPRQPDARTSICAQPVGTGVSEYWPHNHATRVWAEGQCDR